MKKVLLTGASGYVGGRLLSLLEQDSHFQVRCLARHPKNIRVDVDPGTEMVTGDVLKPESLEKALEGIDIAYYLIHSLGSKSNFEQREREGARNFVRIAEAVGVKRIIYLGGLGEGPDLSAHLRSRQAVGKIFQNSKILCIEFRASVIIGSGSLSFELVRSLTEKLPVMITPRWVWSKAQPIAIRNVLDYLLAAAKMDFSENLIFEIGGPDQVPYAGLIREYARIRGLKRFLISVPVLTPKLSSLWLGLVTPVYARIGKKLIESLEHDTIVTDNRALDFFKIEPMGYSEAIKRAIAKEDKRLAETHWYDAASSAGIQESYGGTRFGSRLVDVKMQTVPLSPEKLFAPVMQIGGKRGWYFANFLWRIRGLLDLLLGGVGMRRGRGHPENLRVGDTLDFWRVKAFEANKLLLLQAEMKVPGRAWLQFEVIPKGEQSVLTQTAIFDPIGLWGLFYWYALYPAHALIFRGMLSSICKHALRSNSNKKEE